MAETIILGVTGSVASYRAADLARELMRSGFEVRVCLTASAEKFVTRALFEALTGQPVLQDAFEEPEPGRMAHIDWARKASAVIIAPATANTIAKLASGIGDDMLTTVALATDAPLVIAPAMNPTMYGNTATQDALARMNSRGAVIVEAKEGDVACGEHGTGKLASIEEIVDAIKQVVGRKKLLAGKHVLITSGPTIEAIDSVRFLSNRSSGKMGAALARAAHLMGAEVTVISGPSRTVPSADHLVMVESAEQMLGAAMAQAPHADIIIGAAAVADYRVDRAEGKLRRSEEPVDLRLIPNPDIIATLAAAAPHANVVGFAAEPSADTSTAQVKLRRKGLHALAFNDVSRSDIGFGSDFNDITLFLEDGSSKSSGRLNKLGCAFWLLEQLADS